MSVRSFLFFLAFVVCPATGPVHAQELPGQLLLQGERFLNMGKYEAALGQYAKVIACCENSTEGAVAHNDMGVASMRLDRPDEALAHYEAAIAIADYPLAYFNLGKALLDRYRAAGDEADAERALELLTHFDDYLRHADPDSLPPCITWEREEFDAYLRHALETLRN